MTRLTKGNAIVLRQPSSHKLGTRKKTSLKDGMCFPNFVANRMTVYK